ncbi:MAG: antitoxin AF2212-like protein [Dissulfuribacterales bacterium]|nr:antitoxin family protein [Candidatus Bipolaricaulota bacterium]
MQIDAIYDNGIIKPLVPLKLKKKSKNENHYPFYER